MALTVSSWQFIPRLSQVSNIGVRLRRSRIISPFSSNCGGWWRQDHPAHLWSLRPPLRGNVAGPEGRGVRHPAPGEEITYDHQIKHPRGCGYGGFCFLGRSHLPSISGDEPLRIGLSGESSGRDSQEPTFTPIPNHRRSTQRRLSTPRGKIRLVLPLSGHSPTAAQTAQSAGKRTPGCGVPGDKVIARRGAPAVLNT